MTLRMFGQRALQALGAVAGLLCTCMAAVGSLLLVASFILFSAVWKARACACAVIGTALVLQCICGTCGRIEQLEQDKAALCMALEAAGIAAPACKERP